MNVHIADILKTAYDLKVVLTPHKIAYVIALFDCKAEDDPTGYWGAWIEQLLDECDDEHHIKEIDSLISNVFEDIKFKYAMESDVTMAEFLLSYKTPQVFNGYNLSSWVIMQAIDKIIEWDEISWRYCVKENGTDWEVFEIDSVTYDGVLYPVRIFEVTHDDDDIEHTYMIAPERLNDAMIAKEGEDATVTDGTEAQRVDEYIYHYVEDTVFFEDAKYICKACLDIPMKLIEELI